MNLKSKRILVFGGDLVLMNKLIPGLNHAGAHVTWVNSGEILEDNFENGQYFKFDQIKSVAFYVNILEPFLRNSENFDGILFALSEGTLRPIGMTNINVSRQMLEVNYLTFVELIRLVLKTKKLNKGSSILALSSISSIRGLKSKMAYAASKASLNSAVLNMAAELMPKGIRVNAILKGALTTDMEQKHVQDMFAIGQDDSNKSNLGLTSSEELTTLCILILSDALKTMTGTLLKLDGGYSL